MMLISPLEQFIRDDLQEVEKIRDEAEAVRRDFDQAQLKYDVARTKSSKSKPVNKLTQNTLDEARKTLEASELALATKLQDFRVKKEFEILERLCTYLFAEAHFYHEGHQRLSRLEPVVRELMNSLVHAQRDYIEGDAAVDEVIAAHRVTSSAPTPIELDLHFKQGYINLKKKNTWTRRWLVVNKGLLFLHRTWKELDPIKCANLLLCTVKQVASDRPNTLMVISPELSLTIQALDEEDLRQWVAVVEAGIGWQLTKKQQDSAEQKNMTSVSPLPILGFVPLVAHHLPPSDPREVLLSPGPPSARSQPLLCGLWRVQSRMGADELVRPHLLRVLGRASLTGSAHLQSTLADIGPVEP